MFTAESLLGYDLISEDVRMHSHLEPLGRIAVSDLKDQVRSLFYCYPTVRMTSSRSDRRSLKKQGFGLLRKCLKQPQHHT